MARDIKGITIEINGSTTGLSKALSGVNSTLSTVQKSLRDTEHLLKLDPNNTELLRQKQALLKEAIEETNKKLEMEKEALKQAADQDVPADKMDALQREIIATTQQLQTLEEKAKETGKTFEESMKAAGEKVQAVGDKVSDVGESMTKGLTTPIVAAAGASIAAFNDVDAGLDTVTKKTGATGDALKEMQDIAKEIPTTMNVGFEAAGAAVGEVNTRFGVTGTVLEDLSTKFLKFAELNDTDVSTSIDEVQKAMEAHNVAAEDAGDFLDTLNKVAQDTGVNVIALAQSMTKNAPAMQELGFNASDSANFLGDLEKKGIDATVVTNGLSKALANAAKDGKSMPEALAELQASMGSASTEAEATAAAIELFGAKSGPAIAKAVQEGQLSFEALGTSLTDAAGNIDTTFEEIQDGPDKFAQSLNTAKLIGADVGATLLEMLVPALETLHTLLETGREKWEALTEDQKQMIITIAGIVAAIGPALVVIGKVISLVGSVINFFPTLVNGIQMVGTGAKALWAILAANPIGVVIAIIAALVAAFVYLWNTSEKFRNFWIGVWDNLVSKATGAKDTLFGVLNGIGEKFSSIFNGAKSTVSGAINFIKGLFNFSWSLPQLKLPHFSISGGFSLNPPSVPHIGIDWYDKAMDKVRVLTGPSFFGYDAKANRLLGGGESGNEVVSGERHLIDLIDGVVGGRLAALGGAFERISAGLDKYMPALIAGQNRPVVLDTDETVGGIGQRMNEQLNTYAERDKWQ